jgi:hypothetical protein
LAVLFGWLKFTYQPEQLTTIAAACMAFERAQFHLRAKKTCTERPKSYTKAVH